MCVCVCVCVTHLLNVRVISTSSASSSSSSSLSPATAQGEVGREFLKVFYLLFLYSKSSVFLFFPVCMFGKL